MAQENRKQPTRERKNHEKFVIRNSKNELYLTLSYMCVLLNLLKNLPNFYFLAGFPLFEHEIFLDNILKKAKNSV